MRNTKQMNEGTARNLSDQELQLVWGGAKKYATIHLAGYEKPYLYIEADEQGYRVDTNIENSTIKLHDHSVSVTIS